jgi:hypothetical protein
MAASRKKRAKPRAKVKAKTRTAAPAGLKALDAEWRAFIDRAADEKPLTEAWPDPAGVPSRPRKQAAKKKAATKKSAKKKAPKKAVRKTATKK